MYLLPTFNALLQFNYFSSPPYVKLSVCENTVSLRKLNCLPAAVQWIEEIRSLSSLCCPMAMIQDIAEPDSQYLGVGGVSQAHALCPSTA